MTIAETLIEKLEYETQLAQQPRVNKSDDWKETAHHWLVTINGVTTDYYTGLAHRERKAKLWTREADDYKRLASPMARLTQTGFERLLQVSKATPPKVDDVLYSLVMDSEAAEMSFDDWCDCFGYDSDSIKARDIYFACQNSVTQLREMGLHDISAAREAYSDY